MHKIETNPVSLDVICNWGEFFGLTYDYKIEKNKKIWRKLISTCFIAEIGEILEFISHVPSQFEYPLILETVRWPRGKIESTLHFLSKLGIAEITNGKYILTEKTFDFQEMILLAKGSGVLFLENGDKSILIADRVVSEQNFKEAVLKSYKEILAELDVYAPISVSIAELRAETCEKLRISGGSFDSHVIRLYEKYKENVWLTGASQTVRQRASREEHVLSGKPLKYENRYFSFVTLVWEKIE
jgi:hypothetical protein